MPDHNPTSPESTSPVEVTRAALSVAIAFMELPGNERQQFRDAIMERAAAWHAAALLGQRNPSPWPMVLSVALDPRV